MFRHFCFDSICVCSYNACAIKSKMNNVITLSLTKDMDVVFCFTACFFVCFASVVNTFSIINQQCGASVSLFWQE